MEVNIMQQVQETPETAKGQEASQAAPAPLIFVVVLLAGILLSVAFPVNFLPRVVTVIAGAVCVLLPFGLGFCRARGDAPRQNQRESVPAYDGAAHWRTLPPEPQPHVPGNGSPVCGAGAAV